MKGSKWAQSMLFIAGVRMQQSEKEKVKVKEKIDIQLGIAVRNRGDER